MAHRVTGELFEKLTGQLFEIERQLRQKSGYAFNPDGLKRHLQAGIEGEFVVLPDHILSVDYFVPPHLGFEPLKRNDVARIDVRKMNLVTIEHSAGETHLRRTECLNRLKKQARRDGFEILDVRVMEELLKRPHLIPEEWKKVNSPQFLGSIGEIGHTPALVWTSYWQHGYAVSLTDHGFWMPERERVVVLMKN